MTQLSTAVQPFEGSRIQELLQPGELPVVEMQGRLACPLGSALEVAYALEEATPPRTRVGIPSDVWLSDIDRNKWEEAHPWVPSHMGSGLNIARALAVPIFDEYAQENGWPNFCSMHYEGRATTEDEFAVYDGRLFYALDGIAQLPATLESVLPQDTDAICEVVNPNDNPLFAKYLDFALSSVGVDLVRLFQWHSPLKICMFRDQAVESSLVVATAIEAYLEERGRSSEQLQRQIRQTSTYLSQSAA